ncbi:hypothetical protein [Chitinophaga vietnamensis]|uniref:hypothetical protein n=1 Tax=Chitinophaga vietnamensis TaxID=2593957 RepID=UPI001178592C|nr:hypothetical protein [Chitinophaga vietnamensis]
MKLIYLKRIHAVGMLILAGCLLMASCRKTDFPDVSNPAYLRVFNCLTYNATIASKDAPPPFLAMLIDPKLDAAGVPVDAAITFDFLDTRGPLARPYPDAGNTTLWQKEFPGTAKIPVGPIVNGFDLSGYGMVSGGKHRFMFVARPQSNDPFYSLNADLRKRVMIDTTVDLTSGEIYTMNVLEKSVYTRVPGIYLRNEQFTKIPFSDSMVYVNFYNLSSEGYSQTYFYNSNGPFNHNIKDTMNVFYTLYGAQSNPIKGFSNVYMTTLMRSQDTKVSPYSSFPLFPDTTASHIFAGNAGQMFNFLVPGTPPDYQYGANNESGGIYTSLSIGPNAPVAVYNFVGDVRTGMVISVHSGIYNPRSFATVNTVEFVNGNMYVTTLQRRYDPPVYQ